MISDRRMDPLVILISCIVGTALWITVLWGAWELIRWAWKCLS